jgi:hypothetical protein
MLTTTPNKTSMKNCLTMVSSTSRYASSSSPAYAKCLKYHPGPDAASILSQSILATMDRIFKRPFLWPELYRTTGRDVNSFFCLMKNPLLYRSAWPESSREASERFLMETLRGTQSERRRRPALAGGFRLLRSSGIDRLNAPAHAPGRRSAGPDH